MQTLLAGWRLLRPMMKRAGPYMLIELLLPGGTLLALILFIARSGALNALQPMAVTVASTERSQCCSFFSTLTSLPERIANGPSLGVAGRNDGRGLHHENDRTIRRARAMDDALRHHEALSLLQSGALEQRPSNVPRPTLRSGPSAQRPTHS